ncbi:hypothetical protein MIDIC_330001 [Alphaproteobacteria bacterium]
MKQELINYRKELLNDMKQECSKNSELIKTDGIKVQENNINKMINNTTEVAETNDAKMNDIKFTTTNDSDASASLDLGSVNELGQMQPNHDLNITNEKYYVLVKNCFIVLDL